MRHRLALCLLGQVSLTLPQRFFGMFAFGQIAADTLNTDRFAITKDQPSTDFEPNTTPML